MFALEFSSCQAGQAYETESQQPLAVVEESLTSKVKVRILTAKVLKGIPVYQHYVISVRIKRAPSHTNFGRALTSTHVGPCI